MTALCVDAQNRNSCAEFFCIRPQKLQNKKFCVYMQKLHITAMCVDAQSRNSCAEIFRVCPQKLQNKQTDTQKYVCVNENFLEVLRICAYFTSVEFAWTYAKPLHAQAGVSVRKWKTSGVSADMRRLLLLGICVSTQMNNFYRYGQLLEREKRHQLPRYADHPIREFLRPYAKKKKKTPRHY